MRLRWIFFDFFPNSLRYQIFSAVWYNLECDKSSVLQRNSFDCSTRTGIISIRILERNKCFFDCHSQFSHSQKCSHRYTAIRFARENISFQLIHTEILFPKRNFELLLKTHFYSVVCSCFFSFSDFSDTIFKSCIPQITAPPIRKNRMLNVCTERASWGVFSVVGPMVIAYRDPSIKPRIRKTVAALCFSCLLYTSPSPRD